RGHLALVRLHQAGERRDEGGFARAGGAHHHGHLAGAGFEVDALQHGHLGAAGLEPLGEALGGEAPNTILGADGFGRFHLSRSAGWLFFRMPSAGAPEAIERIISMIATHSAEAGRITSGSPAAVVAKETSQVRAKVASRPTTPTQND